MGLIALVLGFLASSGHAFRLHASSDRKHSGVYQNRRSLFKARNTTRCCHSISELEHSHSSKRGGTQNVLSKFACTLLDVDRATIAWHETGVPATAAIPKNCYVHIPFCRRRCFYCDFPIKVVGDVANAVEPAERYVTLLEREMSETALLHGPGCQAAGGLQTLYFGGGTPSLLPPPLLCRIIDKMNSSFGLSPTAEVTLEMDPGTFDRAKLDAFIQCGINRVSLGVQSVHESLLKGAGRAHSVEDVFEAVRVVKDAGIDNWSLDLISGLPNETVKQWQQTLNIVLSELQPPHVSIYDLQVEEGTAFGKWFSPGVAPLPDDEESAEMYKQASQTLTAAGYQHYEVSSYALPGFRSKHNSCYWKMRPFLGMGLGASSYLDGKRFARPRDMRSYEEWVASMNYGDEEAEQEQDELDLLLDEIMVALRTSDGLDLSAVAQRYGSHKVNLICDAVGDAQSHGLAIIDNDQTNLRLSSPDGFLVSNDIISTIFAKLMPD